MWEGSRHATLASMGRTRHRATQCAPCPGGSGTGRGRCGRQAVLYGVLGQDPNTRVLTRDSHGGTGLVCATVRRWLLDPPSSRAAACEQPPSAGNTVAAEEVCRGQQSLLYTPRSTGKPGSRGFCFLSKAARHGRALTLCALASSSLTPAVGELATGSWLAGWLGRGIGTYAVLLSY